MIAPKIEAVFIHVSDVPRALGWYAKLLGLPPGVISHEGLIADLVLDSGGRIILDGHAHAQGTKVDRQGARLVFPANDLDAARQHALEVGDNVTEPEDIGSARVFYVDDPDGNTLCISWRKPDRAGG